MLRGLTILEMTLLACEQLFSVPQYIHYVYHFACGFIT